MSDELLSREEGARRAKKMRGAPDPFDEISPSLLSAEHIEKYVLETGLISPFYRRGEKDPLKKATYEGRIGNRAYAYDEKGDLVSIPVKPSLLIEANSIVFVESDLDFRLPRYIALRFNLQIRHVHRGLLLGTGPLVDPDYWGKLCIPLHNLTDADYEIPHEEGLIWIEFTKTTGGEGGRSPLDVEKGKEYWDIEELIRKAATPLVGDKTPVPIRSSIPLVVAEANEAARTALGRSEEAVTIASKARKKVNTIRNVGFIAGTIATLTVVIGVIALWATFFVAMGNKYDGLSSTLTSLERGARDSAERLNRFD